MIVGGGIREYKAVHVISIRFEKLSLIRAYVFAMYLVSREVNFHQIIEEVEARQAAMECAERRML
jgi:hypothetical protein